MCAHHVPNVWFDRMNPTWYLIMFAEEEAFVCRDCWQAMYSSDDRSVYE